MEIIIILLYIIPTIVALIRKHSNTASIILTNLLLGWTFLGWVVALIWSFSSNVVERKEKVKIIMPK